MSNSLNMKIAGRSIGSNHKPYVIAEMSANHNGNIDRAFKIIDEAKKAGADAVKLQTYTPDTITLNCDKEDFQIRDGLWKGQTLYELGALSIPTIAIQVIDNQNEDIEGWKEKSLIHKVIPWDDELVCQKVCSALYDLKSIEVRQGMINRVKDILSGNSVVKIIDILIANINVKNRK